MRTNDVQTLANVLLALQVIFAPCAALASELEFLFAPDRAISLTNRAAQVPIGSPFSSEALKRALPGYEVRFFSADEQSRMDRPMGGEGTAQSVFIVEKAGEEVLVIYGDDTAGRDGKGNVVHIVAESGVIDTAGATIGSALNKAALWGKVACVGEEVGFCWSPQMPQISYVPYGGEGCDLTFIEVPPGTEVSASQIPDCVLIGSIGLGGLH